MKNIDFKSNILTDFTNWSSTIKKHIDTIDVALYADENENEDIYLVVSWKECGEFKDEEKIKEKIKKKLKTKKIIFYYSLPF